MLPREVRIFQHIKKELRLVFLLTAIALVLIGVFSRSSVSSVFEAKFSDDSHGGLAIVPASCPSNAHFPSECGSSCTCPSGLVNISGSCIGKVVITSATGAEGLWVVPSTWNNSNNSIEVIGGGGGGASGYGVRGIGGGGGGGGGAYAKISNLALTPGSSVAYYVGRGGMGADTSNETGFHGEATYFGSQPIGGVIRKIGFETTNGCSLGYVCAWGGGAGGGQSTVTGTYGTGGQVSQSYGTLVYSGGDGFNSSGGGGGGAAGPSGAGGSSSGLNGGVGGAGAGGAGGIGGVGGNGTEFGGFGSGGGGGGGTNGGKGGYFGGGGGGTTQYYWSGYTGGDAGSGLIVITWYPATAVSCTSPLTVTNAAISPKPVTPNGTIQYKITVSASTGSGGANIGSEYSLVNYQGPNQGSYRGYVGWSSQSFPYWGGTFKSAPIACTGGGQGAIYGGSSGGGYGSQYINLISCSTSVSGNTRTSDFVVTFNANFTAPTTNNYLSGFAQDTAGIYDVGSGASGGWRMFDHFDLGACVPSTYSCLDGTTRVDNCGTQTVCAAGETCSGAGTCSSCVPDGTFTCSDGTHRKDSCGNITACVSGSTCSNGACSCTPDGTFTCSDATHKKDSCGNITACAAGQTCAGGICSACTPDGTFTCSDATHKKDSCGNITACLSGETCSNGVCAASCIPDGTLHCSGTKVLNSCNAEQVDCADTGRLCSAGACVCPSGTTWNGSACVPVCTPNYFCSGANLYHQDASCTNSLVQACAYGCTNGACNNSPSPAVTFSVVPLLVHSGDTTAINWTAQNVTSCTVTGSNGDSWSGTSGSKTSSAITGQTVYSIHCTGVDGSNITQSKTVNIIPTFCEPGVPGC